MGKFKDSPLTQFLSHSEPRIGKKTTTPANTPGSSQAAPKTHRKPRKRADAEERRRRATENARYYSTPITPFDFRADVDRAAPRTRRVQLLMKPGLHSELKAIAYTTGQSLNHLIESVLLQYIDEQRDTTDDE